MGILDWFTQRPRKRKATRNESLRKTGSYVAPAKPRHKSAREQGPAYSGHVSGRIVDGGSGKNVLMRNKYVREDTGTHETLKIVDDSILEDDDEVGADPYNTGRFDRAKSWNSTRSRD
jgi:hypothetical protein